MARRRWAAHARRYAAWAAALLTACFAAAAPLVPDPGDDPWEPPSKNPPTPPAGVEPEQVFAAPVAKESEAVNRIAGGYPAPPYPFAAAVIRMKGDKSTQWCGASVIARSWVLTAAHCHVTKRDQLLIGRARLGDGSAGELQLIGDVIPHPLFNGTTYENDIALVRLQQRTSMAPISLASKDPPPGAEVSAIGWGNTTYKGQRAYELQQVDVPIVSTAECKVAHGDDPAKPSLDDTIQEGMLCAGVPGKDACQGDSGGPLFEGAGASRRQVGVVSKGHSCGETYGIYTSIPQNRTWIQGWIDSTTGGP